jgi:hypothetical protein
MGHSRKKEITRRQFIKATGAAVALPILLNELPFYGSLAHAAEESDLVIAKNGSPSQLLGAALMLKEVISGQRQKCMQKNHLNGIG